jgi:ABC-2 type transport system permease protein
MNRNTLAIASRIDRQLIGDRRFLALALFLPLIIFYLFKVFIRTLPVELFANPQELYIMITAFIIHFTSYVLCLIVIVRERRDETLIRMFVNNFSRTEVVIGYLLGYASLATLQALLIMVEVHLLFHLSYGWGLMLSLFVVMWTLSLISIALGIMVSNLARTEAQIFPFIPLFILTTIFISGLILPLSSIPWSVRWLSYLIPFTYAQILIKSLIAEGGGLLAHLSRFGILILYGILLLFLSSMTLKQRE